MSSFNPSTPDDGGLDLDVAELAAQLEAFDRNDHRARVESDLPGPELRQSVDEMIAAVGAQGIEEIEALEAGASPSIGAKQRLQQPGAGADGWRFSRAGRR